MTDTYELDPDFVEHKPKHRARAPPVNIVSSPVPQLPSTNPEPPKSNVITSFYDQNKLLIIITIAIVIVLLLIFIYWYFSKPKESLNPVPGPPKHDLARSKIPDNVPPPNLEQIPMQQKQNSTQPLIQNHQPIQNQKSGMPLTHENLVANADDAEIDRFANPEETVFEQKTPKKSNKKDIKIKEKVSNEENQDDDENRSDEHEDQETGVETQDDDQALLSDLEDLESTDS